MRLYDIRLYDIAIIVGIAAALARRHRQLPALQRHLWF